MEEANNNQPTPNESLAEEKRELWIVTKIKTYAKEKPKETFIIMFSLVVLSVIISVSHLIYVRQIEVPKYREMKKTNIFQGAENSLSAPITATENVLDLRDAMKELEYYKSKPVLTKQDSTRIKYLIDKYNVKPKR